LNLLHRKGRIWRIKPTRSASRLTRSSNVSNGRRDERAERAGQVGLDAAPGCRQSSPTASSWPPPHQTSASSASRLESRRRGTARKCSRPFGPENQWAGQRPPPARCRGRSCVSGRQSVDRPRPSRARDAVAGRPARRTQIAVRSLRPRPSRRDEPPHRTVVRLSTAKGIPFFHFEGAPCPKNAASRRAA